MADTVDILQCGYSNLASPKTSSGGGAVVGTRNDSLAQAPKSWSLQRSLQKGRHLLLGANTLSPLQLGQATIVGGFWAGVGAGIANPV